MKKIIFLEATNWEKEIIQKYPDFLEKVDFSLEKLTLEIMKLFLLLLVLKYQQRC